MAAATVQPAIVDRVDAGVPADQGLAGLKQHDRDTARSRRRLARGFASIAMIAQVA